MKLPAKRWANSPSSDYFGILGSQEQQQTLRSGDNDRGNLKMFNEPSIGKRMSSNAFENEGREFGEMFREGGGINFAQQHWSHIVLASLLAVVALAAVGVNFSVFFSISLKSV